MYVIFWDWVFRGLQDLKSRTNAFWVVLKPGDQNVDFISSVLCLWALCVRILFQPVFGFDFLGLLRFALIYDAHLMLTWWLMFGTTQNEDCFNNCGCPLQQLNLILRYLSVQYGLCLYIYFIKRVWLFILLIYFTSTLAILVKPFTRELN